MKKENEKKINENVITSFFCNITIYNICWGIYFAVLYLIEYIFRGNVGFLQWLHIVHAFYV